MEGPHCGADHWKVVFAGSRFTTDAESRYAPIEGEALAVVYGLESSKLFVTGCPRLIVSVDHRPLLKLLSDDQPLDLIKNPRLQRLKERAMRYQFQIKHTPGKKNACADAASRYPVENRNQHEEPESQTQLTSGTIYSSLCHVSEAAPDAESDLELTVRHETMVLMADSPHLQAVTWDRIKTAAAKDTVCRDLVSTISSGFPTRKRDLQEHLRPFWVMRDELYSVDQVPIKDGRIFIPAALRKEVLECLHAAHQGVTGMQENAKHRLFWPGLDAALRLTRAQCFHCNNRAPSQPPEPLLALEAPEFPFQSTATDLFHFQGHKFLLYVDRFTAWLEIALSPRSDAHSVIKLIRRWFTTFGVPVDLASDGGPPFDSFSYKQFLKCWGVSRRLSSAYFPRSNGRAELGVKSGKRLLMANIDSTGSLDKDTVSRALMMYRNTPLQDGSPSPAELLYGRKLRDHLPMIPSQVTVMPKWKEIRDARETIMGARIAERAEKSQVSCKPLQPLSAGQNVLIQNCDGQGPNRWNKAGVIVEILPFRQYRVKYSGSGRLQVRNRQHLRPFVPQSVASYPQASSIVIPEDNIALPAHTSTPNRPNLDNPRSAPLEVPSWRANLTPEDETVIARPPVAVPAAPVAPTDQPPTPHDASDTIPYDITNEYPDLRRSTRHRRQPARLSPKFQGKTHIRKDTEIA